MSGLGLSLAIEPNRKYTMAPFSRPGVPSVFMKGFGVGHGDEDFQEATFHTEGSRSLAALLTSRYQGGGIGIVGTLLGTGVGHPLSAGGTGIWYPGVWVPMKFASLPISHASHLTKVLLLVPNAS